MPKYFVRLRLPNAFNLEWVYSVPCGEKDCESWVSINTENTPSWGPDKKAWIANYIDKLGWNQVVNPDNKRFQCPSCANPFPRFCI